MGSKWNTDLNITLKAIKILEENIENNCDFELGKSFSDMTPNT